MFGNASIWQLSGVTAAIGMGVVFVALFLLSVYMHYFKNLVTRFEGRRAAPATPPPRKRAAPALAAAPQAAEPRSDAARVAAAVAVGLHLQGVGGSVPGPVAAAIATALSLQRGRAAAAVGGRSGGAAGWRLAGRMEAMATRSKGSDRPRRR